MTDEWAEPVLFGVVLFGFLVFLKDGETMRVTALAEFGPCRFGSESIAVQLRVDHAPHVAEIIDIQVEVDRTITAGAMEPSSSRQIFILTG